MAATTWTRFYWADWHSDPSLHLCSLAARGLWMEMLTFAARQDPIGYLCMNGESLSTSGMARYAGASEAEVVSLIAELDRNGVLTRDRQGRIYSRRMVRDAKAMAIAKKSGKAGGIASRDKQRGIFDPPKAPVDGPPAPIHQNPIANKQDAREGRAPLLLACDAMGIQPDALLRFPAWMLFEHLFAELVGDGCEPERDVWPTIRKLHSRLRGIPRTPAYFKPAILLARDRRRAEEAAVLHAPPQEVAERLALFAREGVWSSKWGPRPDEVSP